MGGLLDCALAITPALVSTWQMPGLAPQEARMCATLIVVLPYGLVRMELRQSWQL